MFSKRYYEDMKVKVCGQTRAEDCRFSFESGAALCGVVVEVPSSPRSMSIDSAKPLFDEFGGKLVALTANASHELYEAVASQLKPFAVQLTADETEEQVKKTVGEFGLKIFKSLHLPPEGSGAERADGFLQQMERYAQAGVSVFILDTRVPDVYGGSGVKSDWELARKIIEASGAETFLAGGISPDNVLEAAALGPAGIDLASGVEEAPGHKSRQKITALFAALEAVNH